MKEIENLLVKHYAGSHSYGTNTATSDVDFRGIFSADKRTVLSPFLNVKEVTDTSEEDTKYYELVNYMKLYLNANPNVMETLWVDEKHIVQSSEGYELLRKYRQEMMSTRLAFTFTGFAHAQSTRLKNHSSWIAKERNGMNELQSMIDGTPCVQMKDFICDNFPEYVYKHLDFSECNKYIKGLLHTGGYMRSPSLQMLSSNPPQHKSFLKLQHNFVEEKVLTRDFDIRNYSTDHILYPYGNELYGLIPYEGGVPVNDDGSIHKVDTATLSETTIKKTPLFLVKYCKKEYELACDNRNNYHTWKKNRNASRAELEFEHGYDTKFAMHTVRILRMAEEALSTGELIVYRPDAQELLDIKNGKWSYEEVMQFNEETIRNITDNLYHNSVLPKKPNINLASDVVVQLREFLWYNMK